MPDNRGAQALRRVLLARKQTEIAAETGISQSHISRLAHGEKTPALREDALLLKAATGIEPEWWDEPAEELPPDTERAS